MSETTIPFTLTDDIAPEASFLAQAHGSEDAAYDLRAAQGVSLMPGDRVVIPTGVRVAIPEGMAGLVLPRSGLALKHGITVLNAPGLIDPGYRGEIGVILAHMGLRMESTTGAHIEPYYHVAPGDRIAQLLIVRTADVGFHFFPGEAFEAAAWAASERGEGGFGSSGR